MFSKFAGSFGIMKYRGLIIILILGLTACQNKYQKLLKGSEYEKQYEVANIHYNEGDFYKAQQLYENVISVYRGSTKGEISLINLARCHLEMGDFMLAGYYYKTFATTYPNSERIEDAQYFSAMSYYYESPKPSLDQQYTIKAIDEFQTYINQFPESARVDSCNTYISILRDKLELKAYNIAKLYVNLQKYKAAKVELVNYLMEFPDSEFREDVKFLLVESSFELAQNSVKSKQFERYEDAIDNYYDYIDEYPNGEKAKEAERIYTACKKYIDKY